ncbi:DUF2889 domain-containing protein [Pseudorhodoferax sp. LjRoot39]|uniref:DUF2889 domain-containing protein n=1 Tax=Pseudorhodoferax sp. LjRoot39 TaxID=3342328 RepID=UPI003ECE3D7C
MGRFRRRIVIVHRMHTGQAPGAEDAAGEARACLEDDFHHFRVSVLHRGGRVQAVQASAPRTPYTLCGIAAEQLQRLQGMALSPVAGSVSRVTDASDQCTHQFDLAGLAIAAAASARPRREYDIEVEDRVGARSRAAILRDGRLLLEWMLDGSTIAGPVPFEGVSLKAGFARLVHARLPVDDAEAAIALRRCALISLGRGKPLDQQLHAAPTGLCFAQQPQRAPQALRVVGSTWDFSDAARRSDLCADDGDWLAFR